MPSCDVLARARELEVEWVEDPTNADHSYERNEVRHWLREHPAERERVRNCLDEPSPPIPVYVVSAFRAEISRKEAEHEPERAFRALGRAVPGASIASATAQNARDILEKGGVATLSSRGAALHLGRERVIVERSFERGCQDLGRRDAGVVHIGDRAASVRWFDWHIEIDGTHPGIIRGPRPGDRFFDGTTSHRVNELLRDAGIDVFDRWRVPIIEVDDCIVAIADIRSNDGARGIQIEPVEVHRNVSRM